MNPQQHVCTVCGKRGGWSDSWQWYGSYNDMDAGTIAKLCSAECRARFSPDSMPKKTRKSYTRRKQTKGGA